MGVFARMMEGLAPAGSEQKTIRIDTTYLEGAPHSLDSGAEMGSQTTRAGLDRTDESWVEHQGQNPINLLVWFDQSDPLLFDMEGE